MVSGHRGAGGRRGVLRLMLAALAAALLPAASRPGSRRVVGQRRPLPERGAVARFWRKVQDG